MMIETKNTQDRVDELNVRFQNRQFPDISLSPNFSPIPISTKYTNIQKTNFNHSTPANVVILPEIHHVISMNFNPATRNAPPSGYFNNIDDETMLRNQQRQFPNREEYVFIPSSKSELYNDYMSSNKTSSGEQNPFVEHHALFNKMQHTTFLSPNINHIGNDTFFNHTRTQLRNG